MMRQHKNLLFLLQKHVLDQLNKNNKNWSCTGEALKDFISGKTKKSKATGRYT
jgi:hypothetical protein